MPLRSLTPVDLPEQSAPGTPASGYGRLYVNTSGQLLFIDDAGATLNLSSMVAGSVGFVNHGSTAGTARPSGYAVIFWQGSVEPTNATNADYWSKTA